MFIIVCVTTGETVASIANRDAALNEAHSLNDNESGLSYEARELCGVSNGTYVCALGKDHIGDHESKKNFFDTRTTYWFADRWAPVMKIRR